MSDRARPQRRHLALASAALVAAACVHARHVGEPGGGGEGAKQEEGASQRPGPARIPPREGRPAVSASPEGLMNPGSARTIQEALKGKGYLEEVTGTIDGATSAALRRFQKDQGLARTGAPDRETLRQLGVDPNDVYQTGDPSEETVEAARGAKEETQGTGSRR
jgi:peptidoglycan hydrolase-like protein with peptidoglycan-binding domain